MRHDTSPTPQPNHHPEARAEQILAELHDAARSLPPLPADAQQLVARMLAEPAQPVPAGLKDKVRAALEAERAGLETAHALAPTANGAHADVAGAAGGGKRARLTVLGRVVTAAAAVLVVVALGLYAANPWGGEESEGDGGGPHADNGDSTTPMQDPQELGRVYYDRAVAPPEAPGSGLPRSVMPVRDGETLTTDAQPLLVELGEAHILMDRNGTFRPHRDYKIELDAGRMAIVTRQRLLVVSPHGEFIVSPHRGEDRLLGHGTAAVVIHRAVERGVAAEMSQQGRIVDFEQRMVPVGHVIEHAAAAFDESLRYELSQEDKSRLLERAVSLHVRELEGPEFVSLIEQTMGLYELELAAPSRPGEGYVVRRLAQGPEREVQPPAWLTAEVRCGTVTLRRPGDAQGTLEVSVAQPMDVPRVLRVWVGGEAQVEDGVLAERWPAEMLDAFEEAPQEIHSDFMLHWPSIPELHTIQEATPEAFKALTLLARLNDDTLIVRDQTVDAVRLLRTGHAVGNWTLERISPSGAQFRSQNEQGEPQRYFRRLATR